MTHNGIDIDQFILLTLYPTAAFFVIGLLARKFTLSEPLKYITQASSCIIFAIVYIVTIPNGGAQGLATVLILFGGILFLRLENISCIQMRGKKIFCQVKRNSLVIKNREKIYRFYGKLVIKNY